MASLNVDKVFVLHVKTGYENRKESILRQFQSLGIEGEFILDGDIPNITDTQLQKYFAGQMSNKIAITSCALKHLMALQQLIDSDSKDVLILEDDAILDTNFKTIFNTAIQEFHSNKNIKTDCTFISFENSTLNFIPASRLKKNQYLYEASTGRCACAYYLTKALAKKIINHTLLHKCKLPIDWHYNEMIQKDLISIYWCHPTIVEQGSHNGLFPSAIDEKKVGLLRRFTWTLQKRYKEFINKFK